MKTKGIPREVKTSHGVCPSFNYFLRWRSRKWMKKTLKWQPRIKNDTKSAVCKQSENPNRLPLGRVNRSVRRAVFFALNRRIDRTIYCQDKGRFWAFSFPLSGFWRACHILIFPHWETPLRERIGCFPSLHMEYPHLENPDVANPHMEKPHGENRKR